MSQLLEFLRAHDEAFRSRNRLASLYSDFRYQKQANPDGYQANASAWLKALAAAAHAGLVPHQSGIANDHFVLRSTEDLLAALQIQDHGRPLALGSVIQTGVQNQDLIPLKDFLNVKHSIYHKSWIPTPSQLVAWGLKQLGAMSGEPAEDKLIKGDYVVMANVEAASKSILAQASSIANSNTSRIFSTDLFTKTFASAAGLNTFSPNDLAVLVTHLSRDREAISYSLTSGTLKFKSPSSSSPEPITEEDNNIASLRTLISSLEPQIQQLTDRVSQLDLSARDAVIKKQLTVAKSALRSKKLAESTLQQRSATLAQLEDVYNKIQQASDQVEIVRVMQSSTATLKSLNKQTGGVEKVQDIMDALQEEMMDADDIQQAISDVSAGTVDEAEVDDELEALETAEREKSEAAERQEREKKEMEEAEQTRTKLAELEDLPSSQAEVATNPDRASQEQVLPQR